MGRGLSWLLSDADVSWLSLQRLVAAPNSSVVSRKGLRHSCSRACQDAFLFFTKSEGSAWVKIVEVGIARLLDEDVVGGARSPFERWSAGTVFHYGAKLRQRQSLFSSAVDSGTGTESIPSAFNLVRIWMFFLFWFSV